MSTPLIASYQPPLENTCPRVDFARIMLSTKQGAVFALFTYTFQTEAIQMKTLIKSTLVLAMIFATAAFSFTTPDVDRMTTGDDIVETAVKAGSFNTLAAALQAAGLVETLKGDGPFTVFAPTDEAFAKLPAGTVENLLKPENKDQLIAILTYHVVSGKVMSSDLLSTTSAPTVNGQSAPIGLRVGNANVIQADIDASNGVIHVIDTVLLPE